MEGLQFFILTLLLCEIHGKSNQLKDTNNSTPIKGPWSTIIDKWTNQKHAYAFIGTTSTKQLTTISDTAAYIYSPDSTSNNLESSEVLSTTEEPITIEVMAECNTSLHSKADIQLIIDYIIKNIHIDDDNFKEDVESVRDYYIADIEHFRHWFLDRPEHLLHILDELKKKRHNIESLLQEISSSFDMLPSLQEDFDNRKTSANRLFQSFLIQNQMCALNCGSSNIIEKRNVKERYIPYKPKEYYCGSIANIHSDITYQFIKYRGELRNKMRDDFERDIMEYHNKTEILKNTLKEMALKEFGPTMYDILNLQDEYAHYDDFIQKSDVHSIIDEIRQTVAQLYPNILSLETAVDKYGKYCRLCGSKHLSQMLRSSSVENSSDKPENDSILDELIEAKKIEIEQNAYKEYANIYIPLQEKIAEAYDPNEYLRELREVQREVVEATEIENIEYEQLKSKISALSFTKLKVLNRESVNLQEKIEKHVLYINSQLVEFS